MTYTTHTADVPSSIALPSDPEDQSPDYDVTVEYYDPGDGDDFVIISSGGTAGPDLHANVEEAIIEWLNENWDRPEPDYGPVDDYDPEIDNVE